MKTSSHTSTFRSENHHKSPVGKVTNRKIQRILPPFLSIINQACQIRIRCRSALSYLASQSRSLQALAAKRCAKWMSSPAQMPSKMTRPTSEPRGATWSHELGGSLEDEKLNQSYYRHGIYRKIDQ